jgi:general stress protein 26
MAQQGGSSTLEVAAKRSRPQLPKDYGMPPDAKGMLTWDWVEERLQKARNYWVCTAYPNGQPHAVPVWAIWLNGTLYLDGHPQTRWARNITGNPAVTVHLESGDEVVILEGIVEDMPHVDRELAEQLAAASNEKYSFFTKVEEMVERGMFAFHPKVALAWGEFPKTMTKWRFDAK